MFIELQALESKKAAIHITDEETVAEYYHLRVQLEKLKQNMRDFLNQPVHSVPFLQPGRLVKVPPPTSFSFFTSPRPSAQHFRLYSLFPFLTLNMQVTNGDQEWGWGVVVNFQKKNEKVHAICSLFYSFTHSLSESIYF